MNGKSQTPIAKELIVLVSESLTSVAKSAGKKRGIILRMTITSETEKTT